MIINSTQSFSIRLTELVALASKDFVVLRDKGKSFFALIPLDDEELEALSLSQKPDFKAMLDKARARYNARGGFSLEEVKQRLRKSRKKAASRKKRV
jgi:hypothetical protein